MGMLGHMYAGYCADIFIHYPIQLLSAKSYQIFYSPEKSRIIREKCVKANQIDISLTKHQFLV